MHLHQMMRNMKAVDNIFLVLKVILKVDEKWPWWCFCFLQGGRCPEGYFHPSNTTDECVCFEDNTAYFQNNHKLGSKNFQKSRYDCQQSCAVHPKCKYWTYSKPQEEGHSGACYLKTARENVSRNLTRYVSGSKDCPLPEAATKPKGFFTFFLQVAALGHVHNSI